MKKRHLIIILLIFIFPILSISQNIQELETLYPDVDAVSNLKSETLTITVSKGDIQCASKVIYDKTILKTHLSDNYWIESVYYNSFEDISKIKGKTKPTENRKSKNAFVGREQSTFSGWEFYSDGKKRNVWFPNIYKGSKISFRYERKYKNNYLLRPFFFMTEEPNIKSTLIIRFPKEVKIGWKYHGPDKYKYRLTKSVKDGMIIYTWEMDSVPPFQPEIAGPNYLELAPKIIFYIKSLQHNQKQIPYFDSIAGLHRWYRTLIKKANTTTSGNIIATTYQLTKNYKTDEEKIKAVYQWVQKNIKYISTSEGLGGFIPDDAQTVLMNRYGDCKGMASITKEMLKHAGIESYYCWIGTNDLPYTYAENFTPTTDNHMILAIKQNDSVKFLDATNSYGEIYKLHYIVQGKEALVSFSDNDFQVYKIPIDNYTQNFVVDSNYIYEENGELYARNVINLYGSFKHRTESEFPIIHEKVIKYIEKNFLTANIKTQIDSIEYTGLKDYSNEMNISYIYHLFNYITETKDKKYINLNLDKPLVDFNIDMEKRKTDYLFQFPQKTHYVAVYNIPESYKPSYIPENKSISFDDFSTQITYTKSEGKIIMTRDIFIKNRRIKKDDFDKWNQMIEVLKEAYSHTLVLEKI